MRLTIVETLAAAPTDAALVVVVDVFSAWASAYAAVDAGARVLLARDADQARALRTGHPDWLLAGERQGAQPASFDFPNSPSLLSRADLTGRTVVLATDAGTPAVFAAGNVQHLLLASFINASTVVETLQNSDASEAWLLAPGERGETRSLEDTMCAMYLKNAVEGYPNRFEALCSHLRSLPSAAAFFDPARPDVPESDFDFCMQLDRYAYALEAVQDRQGFFRVERRCDAAYAPQGGAA